MSTGAQLFRSHRIDNKKGMVLKILKVQVIGTVRILKIQHTDLTLVVNANYLFFKTIML